MKTPSYIAWLALGPGLLVLMLAGCTVGPDYEKPDTTLPDKWQSSDINPGKGDANVIDHTWWENFHDPVLSRLIGQATANNLDLQIAEARIAQARATRLVADMGLLPTGSFKGAADRIGLPDAMPLPGLSNPLNIFQTQFDASWELDLFGGHRRDIEAANDTLQASEASRDDALVSLMAEVARTYVDIRQAQAQLKVAQDTIASDKNSEDIARQRFEAGQSPRLDLTQAEALLEKANAQLPYYTNMLKQAEFGMDVLLGEQPGATQAIITTIEPIPSSNKQLVLAAPAAVIANRPDIRVAERKLAAATAQQGVATAQFFPDVSLSGFFGLLNTNAGNLFTPASQTWMMAGNVAWPLLNYPTLSAKLDVANAQQQEVMATYRKTILGALSDVEKALTAYTHQEQYYQSLKRSVAADRHALDISMQRYKEGLTSYLEVLDAQRTLYAGEDDVTAAEAKTTQDLIAVYKSLGGGWAR